MESRSELVGGEQNGQTVQRDRNDQMVKSPADEIKKRRRPGKDKKYRAKKKQNTEDTERQLENARADYAELKKTHDELEKTQAYSDGQLYQAQKDMELIKGCCSLVQQVVTQQTAWINMLQPLILSLDFQTNHLCNFQTNLFGATMEQGGPVFEESLPQSHQVEQAHRNNVEQPPLCYGGLTHDDDLLGAAMVPSSSLMQGPLAPGGQGGNREQPTSYNADQFHGVN